MPSPIVNGIIISIDVPYVPGLEKGLKDSRARGKLGAKFFFCLSTGLHFEVPRVLPWVGSG